MDIEYWMSKAREALDSMPEGQSFVIKDLVSSPEWTLCDLKDKMKFGRAFKNEVLDGRIKDVAALDTPKNKAAKYKKI